MASPSVPVGTDGRQPPHEGVLQRRWLTVVLIGLVAALSGCLLVWPAIAKDGEDRLLPVSLRALGMADYSADPREIYHPPLQMAIVGDVIRDREPGAADVEVRLTAFSESLQTPVPSPPFSLTDTEPPPTTSGTGSPTAASSASPSPAGTLVGSQTPTVTGSPSSSPTPEETLTPSPTLHPSISPTITLTPSLTPTGLPATATMTATIAAPTATGTLTPTNTATHSPVPPTATATPTSAPPTATSPPPPTNTPDTCSQLSLSDFDREGQQATWDLNNDSGSSVTITSIYFNWQGDNRELVKIELDGDAIWDKKDPHPPAYITGGWKSGVSRTVGAGDSDELLFQFGLPAPGEGYDLEVGLDIGCTVTN